jgi:RNA polymerase sigma-54 factor
MQPLVLRDIARQLELHESTVSRITSGKYLLTPRGVFELRYFFSSRIDDPQGRGISSTSIRARIRRMLQEEDPGNPLPDAEIARRLAADGIPVARRTVAKYRESLGIGSSTERKGVGSR